ncbi:MAG: PAS domain S-box protein [Candidatus Cloacimonetes bacterium]|nr:PAS domain S-box protein [Candidatus Cloacimonadota bacterium]
MKILIVDDNSESLYLLQYILQGKGFVTVTASNGAEALIKLRQEASDLIISDILMPEMDGYQFCREVKKDKQLRHIPFIFYTATYTDREDEEFALKLGADLFLRKPLDPVKIVQEIQNILSTGEINKLQETESVDESEIFQLYSQRLVHKLEKKAHDLEIMEYKYRTLCESVNDLIFSLDEKGCFDLLNCRIDLFGYTHEEIQGKSVLEILTPQSREVINKYFQQAKESPAQNRIPFELEFINKDGSLSIGELSISTSFRENKFKGIFGVVRDITKSRQQEREYKQLIDSMNDTAFVINFDGKFLEVNKTALQVFGYSREEFLNLGPADIDRQISPEAIKGLIANITSDTIQVFETQHMKKDGTVFPVEISSSLVTYKGELAILSIARDITIRKGVEEELQKHRDHLEELVQERTRELEEKNKQLEDFNRVFVGREFRLKELRDKVKVLEAKLGLND